MPKTLRKSPGHGLRDVSHEEERSARDLFLKDLKKKGYKKQEVDAAHSGWEWAFDTGFDCYDSDADAAGDLADMCVEESRAFWKKRGGKSGCADTVYTGICGARNLQRTPDPNAEKERLESIAEIKEATGQT